MPMISALRRVVAISPVVGRLPHQFLTSQLDSRDIVSRSLKVAMMVQIPVSNMH